MAKVRYFYIEDNTAVLFGANGTALTTTLIGASGILSSNPIDIPTFPMWSYLSGLVLAFLCKLVIEHYNIDIRERERNQSNRDFIIASRTENLGNEKFLNELDMLWNQVEEKRKTFMTSEAVRLLNNVRASSFIASAICFLAGTISIIWFFSAMSANEISTR